MDAATRATAALCSLLGNHHAVRFPPDVAAGDLVDACVVHDLFALVYHTLHEIQPVTDSDGALTALAGALGPMVRVAVAAELVRQRETMAVLDALAAGRIHPILLKGAALAYTAYGAPESRPRDDTDLLIRRDQADAARRILVELGYTPQTACDGELLFCQFALHRTDAFGLHHSLDVHWKISTQAAFADVLDFDELASAATPIPALGAHARGPGPLHALLLACIHPAMHHQNVERLIWTYDVHLLAGGLAAAEFETLADLAVKRQVAAVVRHTLAQADSRFGTRIPAAVMQRLAGVRGEPSAAYLQSGRRWHDELISSVATLPRWRDRMRLLREVALPQPAYMFRTYGIADGPVAAVLLPLLYLHRGTRGAWRVVSGRK